MVDLMDNPITGAVSILLIFLCACVSPDQQSIRNNEVGKIQVNLKYAKRFEVWKKDEMVEVSVNSGSGSHQPETYLLIPAGSSNMANIAGNTIKVPVKNLVVTSTSHIPFLSMLGVSEYLAGFPNTKYVSSATVRERIEMGLVKDVGTVNGLNFESLISLQPELVVSYASGADRTQLDQLNQSGIPYVLLQDFMEETPLGRAEWIKFMGLLTGRSAQADSVFDYIEKNYLDLKGLTDGLQEKPTVFSGILYGDTWFAPGADSFAAKFIEHAGGDYTWKDLNGSGSAELSLEAVFDRNMDTEFWIGAGQYTSKTALAEADTRYSNFRAFQTDHVYNYHGSIGPTGGFEYFELGGARPDLVLSDLIKILHSDLLPEYQPYFYKKLD